MPGIAATLLAGAAPVAAQTAAPSFAHIFADHGVLQRDRPIAVWGTAAAGETVTVRLGERSATAVTRADGTWRAMLPAMKAGGPYTLEVAGRAATAQRLSDIMVGDVFLCGGQSNMEFQVRHATGLEVIAAANDADLRFVTIPDTSRAVPAADLPARAAWRQVSPETVGDASAVCYFMARSLRTTEKVPIGFIASEWGGTRIESWMSASALGKLPGFGPGLTAVATYGRDPAAAIAADGVRRERMWERVDPAAVAERPFRAAAFDDRRWSIVPADDGQLSAADRAGIAGTVWLRTTVDLTPEQAAAGRHIQLGPIGRFDETYVNGRYVGGGSIDWAWRNYDLPASVLQAGRNVVAIRAVKANGRMAFTNVSNRAIGLADGAVVPLSGPWRYRIGTPVKDDVRVAPAPWEVPNSLTTLYNGMIAPLSGYGVKLAAWYQGESNAGEAGTYRALLRALMADWRSTFAAPDLPFLVVQLTAFGKAQTVPTDSGWAALRQAQAGAVAADSHAGLAVTIDVGDRFDIHPAQKKVVGERLARLARVVAYGRGGPRTGPEASEAVRQGGDVVVRFRNVTGGLQRYGGAGAIGFERCAGTTCSFVDGVVQGDTIILPGANRPDVTAIRYAWSDAPFVNLFDGADLPAAPFNLPLR
ncbi:MAG: glycoside hydrolase family 2 [Sphingomonas hengshuiensis]|uniref:Glycoside hydrolase family 2 n=1 Tax=Sphingomonas hengshuiensis TaxID=1609977 RepID=A0A2W5AW37_9SPHN|nr:MAG: glycoside hydrolase family 2 [Sphingomonas hengshuiensis]